MAQKFRAFCFTDYKLEINFYKQLKYRYIIIGQEICPTTNNTHWQGYIYFNNARSLKNIIKEFEGRHVEPCKGNAEQNIKYCSKDQNIVIEDGDRPKQGTRTDLEEIKTALLNKTSEKEISQIFFGQWVRYNKSFEKFKSLQEPPRTWKTEVIVLWGPTGTGKSRTAIEAGAEIIEWTGQFILGYKNQEIILIDDFDPADMKREFFLKLTDRYPLKINIKNGEAEWNPKKIYITSNHNPKDWYLGDKAVQRRLDKVEHMTGTEVSEGNTKTSD